MQNHVISGSRCAVQVANPRVPVFVTEPIKNEPRYVDVNRIKAGGPQSDGLRLQIEDLNSAGNPLSDVVKATINPRSPSLDAVGTTKVHRYRKSLFSWNVWSGSRKAVRHSHTCQRNLRVSLE